MKGPQVGPSGELGDRGTPEETLPDLRAFLLSSDLAIPWCLPWHYANDDYGPRGPARVGYGLLWSGPSPGDPILNRTILYRRQARPDLPVIALRILATTALGAAVFAAASMKR